MMVSDFTLWGWYDGVSFRSVSGAGTMVSDFTLWGWYDGESFHSLCIGTILGEGYG